MLYGPQPDLGITTMPIEFHLILFLTCVAGVIAVTGMVVGAALVFSVNPVRVRRVRR